MKTTTTAEQVSQAITTYVALLQAQHDEYMNRTVRNAVAVLGIAQFSVTNGQRYAKLILSSGSHSTSAVAFIDKATGDIYMAASWNKPAKHVRGNVLSVTNGLEAMDSRGNVKYLR